MTVPMSNTASPSAASSKTFWNTGLPPRSESLEVSEEAETEWVGAVVQFGDRTIEFSEHCTPGYYNNEGQPGKASRQGGFYFGGPKEFVEILEAWRADGSMKGLKRS